MPAADVFMSPVRGPPMATSPIPSPFTSPTPATEEPNAAGDLLNLALKFATNPSPVLDPWYTRIRPEPSNDAPMMTSPITSHAMSPAPATENPNCPSVLLPSAVHTGSVDRPAADPP